LVEDAVQIEPMVGRGARRRARAIMPEEPELVRPDPDLLDLVESDAASGADDDDEENVSS
jgi:DNA recombination protein RmuC